MSIEDRINELAVEYDQRCLERHIEGEKKYGPGTWLKIDTIQHAMDEILDFGNYAKFTYIKLALFRDQLVQVMQADSSIAHAQPEYKGFLGKGAVQSGGIPE